jgi:hypothetical protein
MITINATMQPSDLYHAIEKLTKDGEVHCLNHVRNIYGTMHFVLNVDGTDTPIKLALRDDGTYIVTAATTI